MKVFTGDKKSLKVQLETLLASFNNEMSDEDCLLLMVSIAPLIELASDYYNCIDSNEIKSLENYSDITNMINGLIANRSVDFIKNKRNHLLFSYDIIQVMIDNMEEFSEDNSKISEDYLYKIVSEYYLDTSDNGIKILNNLVKDKRLYNINVLDDNIYAATIIDYYTKNSSVITFSENRIKKSMMTTIVHEIEHIKETRNIIENKSGLSTFLYQSGSIYSEVLSLKKEKDFLEYLIENNIEKEYATAELNKYCLTIFTFLNQMLFLSLLDNECLENEEYRKYSKEKLINIYKEKGIDVKNDSLLINLDLDDDILYSYGGILGIYFSYLEKNNPDKYGKVIKKFEKIRVNQYNKNHLHMLGTDMDELSQIVSSEMTKYQKVKNKNYRKQC